jgi:hypothetical protein
MPDIRLNAAQDNVSLSTTSSEESMNVARRTTASLIALIGAGLILPASASYAATNQQRPSATSPSYFPIVNAGANLCLGNNSHGGSDIGRCGHTASQTWYVNKGIVLGDQVYLQFKNRQGNCLGLSGSNGPGLTVGPCASTNDHSQFWWNGDGYLQNGHTGECAGTRGSGTTGGTPVIEGRCANTPTETWVYVIVTDGQKA